MRKLVLGVALGALMAIGFSGCGEEVKTVAYFKQNPKELKQKLEECKNAKSMTESKKQECKNAFFAQQGSEEAWKY